MKRPGTQIRKKKGVGRTPEIKIANIMKIYCVPEARLRALQVLTHLGLKPFPRLDTRTTPTSQMRKLKPREVKPLAQSHRVTQPINDGVRS